MTTVKQARGPQPDQRRLGLAEVIETVTDGPLPVRFTAYDGSAAGPPDAELGLHLLAPRGASYLVTAPGDLGLARAYVSGDLDIAGAHPGGSVPAAQGVGGPAVPDAPAADVAGDRALTRDRAAAPTTPTTAGGPAAVAPGRGGAAAPRTRDAGAIRHHYDVSNAFYERVLGPSMTYTCACYPEETGTLEEAQENKYRLIFDKLRLQEGDRLLDIGCGWGGMVRYAARRGVRAIGATLSREQAVWAQRAIDEEGLGGLAEVRFSDYRDIRETGFDAVSSIGLTEHIGVRNYPTYFRGIRDRLRVGGLLLNHCITRPDNRLRPTGAFIDRYVFPTAS